MSKKRRKTKPDLRERGDSPTVAPTRTAQGESATSSSSRRPFDAVRENLEALVVAVILALIIRHFAVEAFEIPTGSMATTLNGIHAWLECPNCDCEFNVALRTDSATGHLRVPYQQMRVYEGPCPVPGAPEILHQVTQTGAARFSLGGEEYRHKQFPVPSDRVRSTRAIHKQARCPECYYHYEAIIEEDNRFGGHKILVTKFAYQVSEPARWDVIVFTFDQWKNYIKRLVGLPGERIDIWDGDIYVNGEVVRKPEHPYIQDVLWRKIFDSDRPKRDLPGAAPAWVELATSKSGREAESGKLVEWDANTSRWSVNSRGEVAVVDYRHPFDDYTAYNLVGGREYGEFLVGDKKVAFSVRPIPVDGSSAQPSWIGAEIRDREHSFQVRIPLGPPAEGKETVVERLTNDLGSQPNPLRSAHEEGLRKSLPLTLPYDATSRIEFEVVDDRVALRVNSEEKLFLNYSSLPPGDSPAARARRSRQEEHTLRLVFSNAQVMLESVQVYRDIYYIDRDESGAPFGGRKLGSDEYLALGDNSASSSDGRFWGTVPGKNLMGKAFVVIWPLWPSNFQGKRIR